MIKDIVVALLTTTINRYSDLRFSGNMIPREIIIKDLTGTLDYVADIKEEDKEPITVVLNNTKEVEILKKKNEELQKELNIQLRSKGIAIGNVIALEKRIRELEEICQDNNEVIENQFQKIQRLETEYMEGK